MKTGTRLLLPLLAVVTAVMLLFATWAVVNRERSLRTEAQRETNAYAIALGLALEAAYRDRLRTDVQEIIGRGRAWPRFNGRRPESGHARFGGAARGRSSVAGAASCSWELWDAGPTLPANSQTHTSREQPAWICATRRIREQPTARFGAAHRSRMHGPRAPNNPLGGLGILPPSIAQHPVGEWGETLHPFPGKRLPSGAPRVVGPGVAFCPTAPRGANA
jgi:hypothetical protein